ncbi:MAG: hypothetical protein AAF526_04285 [Pseudomonadota bacterium]
MMLALGLPINLRPEAEALRTAFLRWQCRVRQMLMRENQGRPGDPIMPAVTLAGESQPLGHIITVLNKAPGHDKVPEMRHMVQKTHDPLQRREAALRLFSETYFQKTDTFSDVLTATFPPDSPGAARIRAAEHATLTFDAYSQRFDLACRVWRLTDKNPLHTATWWHNLLFNPTLGNGIVVLGFEPDWERSSADPDPRG